MANKTLVLAGVKMDTMIRTMEKVTVGKEERYHASQGYVVIDPGGETIEDMGKKSLVVDKAWADIPTKVQAAVGEITAYHETLALAERKMNGG